VVPAVARRSTIIDLTDVRTAAGIMLAGAAVKVILPHSPGIPCPLRTFTGIPCPLCGMTTSVVATARLRLGEALAANPAGVVAVAIALAVLVFRDRRVIRLPAWTVPLALSLMWVFELHRFHTL
jgi:hypothetical protein